MASSVIRAVDAFCTDINGVTDEHASNAINKKAASKPSRPKMTAADRYYKPEEEEAFQQAYKSAHKMNCTKNKKSMPKSKGFRHQFVQSFNRPRFLFYVLIYVYQTHRQV